MKNKKTFFITYIILISIILISIITLSFLGNKKRIGYLSEFKINVDNTLEINGLNVNETKQLFTINNELDETSINNFIFTNTSITNYRYDFRIKYYSKVFRNSDIYGVYTDTNKIIQDNNFIEEIRFDYEGSPFGILTSIKELQYDEKIDNIDYKLKVKNYFILFIIVLLIILLICISKNYIYKYSLKLNILLKKYKKIILRIYFISVAILIFLILLLSFLGKRDRVGYLSEFNLNIDSTLQLNGLEVNNIKQLFDNELDDTIISNFIFTNESITNYSYNFRIKYHSKVFRNSDIYDVYIDTNKTINNNSFIKQIKTEKFGSPFGILTSTKELQYNDKIDNIHYYLMVKYDVFFYLTLLLLFTLFFISLYLFKSYWLYKRNLSNDDAYFIKIIEIIGISLMFFEFWIFYPGYLNYFDTWVSILSGLSYINHYTGNPLSVELSVKFVNKIGLTLTILPFITIFLWYFSIASIIISLYIKCKNKFVILLYLISLTAQIFGVKFQYLKDFVATFYVVFSYSIVFIIIISPISKKNKLMLKIISLLFLIIGMFYRLNFIVTIYPILIWFTYDFLKTINIKNKFILYFIIVMIINAFILIGMYSIIPKIFYKDIVSPTHHIYFLQIAGCIVPDNDDSMIPNEWYINGKSFDDIKKQYLENSTFGDPFLYIFKVNNSKEIKSIWIKSILKYPKNYIKHMFNYFISFEGRKNIHNNYNILMNEIYLNIVNLFRIDNFKESNFYKQNKDNINGLKFSILKSKIYNFLIKIYINLYIFLFLNLILFIITGLLWLFNKTMRNDILLFSFSTSFSALATTIIVVMFTPVNDYRYIYPMIPISIISIISFITFIYDRGGLKKFIKELKWVTK